MDYKTAIKVMTRLKKNIKVPTGANVILVGSTARYHALVKKGLMNVKDIPKIKDIDFLVLVKNESDLMKPITFKGIRMTEPKKITEHRRPYSLKVNGKTIKVDVFLGLKKDKPYALLHYLSSKFYLIRIRRLVKIKLGLKLNQTGIYDAKTGKKINWKVKTDLDILRKIGGVKIRPYWDRIK
jgi:hypothetical protein